MHTIYRESESEGAGFGIPPHLQGIGTYCPLACDNIVSAPWLTFEVCSNLRVCGVRDRRCDGTPQAANEAGRGFLL